jgi:predicted RNA-binding protein with PUA-like domain
MKCEPSAYSIADLERDRTTIWDGVRNYQARNFLKAMAVGDVAFFYHSNVNPPGIVGIMQVVEAQLVDPSQFDPESPYFDPKATIAAPRWHTVKVEYLKTLDRHIELAELRDCFNSDELIVVRQGNRLSITPVSDRVAEQILKM